MSSSKLSFSAPHAVPIVLLGSALALSGCSVNMVVPPAVPTPLVERLPLRAALHLSNDFVNFVHREENVGGRDWEIAIGAANERMVLSFASALFTDSKQVGGVATAAAEMPGMDLVIVPRLEKFEFSVPSQSATNHYAVWIRYNLDVHDSTGTLLTTWSVSAYGQSGKDGLGASLPLERAAVRAVRDAAATIATGFGKRKDIRNAIQREPAPNAS